jgi:HlyD family secretion protein
MKPQYRAGAVPQSDLIDARAAAESSAAKVQELSASLAVDALPAREQQIKAQQGQVAADRAALADAEWKFEQKRIVSPQQGLVFDTLYRRGEWRPETRLSSFCRRRISRSASLCRSRRWGTCEWDNAFA